MGELTQRRLSSNPAATRRFACRKRSTYRTSLAARSRPVRTVSTRRTSVKAKLASLRSPAPSLPMCVASFSTSYAALRVPDRLLYLSPTLRSKCSSLSTQSRTVYATGPTSRSSMCALYSCARRLALSS